MTKISVLGPSGRMGAQVIRAIAESEGTLYSLLDRPESGVVGKEVNGVTVVSEPIAALSGADVYIDFTSPASTLAAALAAIESKSAAVVGTTGLDDEATAALLNLSRVAPVLVAPNFSLGVNVLLALAERAARALGGEYDLEVVELHHRKKRDAPSGTAIALAESLATGRELNYEESKVYSREGDVGPRRDDEIGVVAVRGGDIIGEHTAYLIGQNERIEISHRAGSRMIFAQGAVRAALWVARQEPGYYSMKDVLGLKD